MFVFQVAQLGLTPEEEAEDQADVAEMSPEEIATNEAAMQVADEAMAVLVGPV